MEIDITLTEYDVELITESGVRYMLNNSLIGLAWEEQISELAQRATISLANIKIGEISLISLAKINCIIMIYGKWGGSRELLFEGTIWEWEYISSTQKSLKITAYDMLIRLQQSKDFKYFSAGLTTQNIIGDICSDWGIPFNYDWGQSLTHEKKVFSAYTISDMIIELLEEVKQKTGGKYIAYFRDGLLKIVGYGTNKIVYKFDGKSTVSTSDKLTINNLVTRVKIIGKEDDDGRVAVDAVVDGDTRFGVLQEILRRDEDKTVGDAKAEADTLIKEKGKPEEDIQVVVPDLPFLRKGDRLEMSAGNLSGFFFAVGVSHDPASKQMTLTLTRG
jgi:hypothetical protein